ncbi:O-antigen polymerase [Calothrix sp. NIES-4071]|nr:O-antigen polymerase [Calothrix sp. NIES-4071]BAZ58364.1 O-antigen polymerase [Calothrix sp. NIES-4105]
MVKIPTIAEKIFVVLSLFFSTTAIIPVLLETQDTIATPDPYSPLIFMGIYAVMAVLIVIEWQSFKRVVRFDIWVWLLVAIAIASIFWTVAPDITPRRSFLLLGTTLFGAYLAMRFTLREQLIMLACACGLVVVLSFVFAIFIPSYGVMSFQEGGVHEGAWRGVMTHKNILGRFTVLSNMIFLFTALGTPKNKYQWLSWVGYGLSAALIILCTSKTALIACTVLTVMFLLYRSWRWNYSYVIPFTAGVVLVVGSAAILIIDNLDVIAGAVGRDLTLTGRTDIWSVMLEKIAERPLTGYGFNAFWRDWDSEVTASVWRQLAWECPYGHNGIMDLLAELGIPGLIAFICSYLIAFIKSVKLLRMTTNVEGMWHLMFLTYLVIYNVSESTLLATNSIYWILYVLTAFSLPLNLQSRNYEYELEIPDSKSVQVYKTLK